MRRETHQTRERPFQKHQGSGRWAQRLGSSGHSYSFRFRPLVFSAAGRSINANTRSFRNATKLFIKLRRLIPSFKRVTPDGTIEPVPVV
jgi:hypothetical protein